jgi:hypothetical protein
MGVSTEYWTEARKAHTRDTRGLNWITFYRLYLINNPPEMI